MFENLGGKIQLIAVILLTVGAGIGVILFAINASIYFEYSEYIGYTSTHLAQKGQDALYAREDMIFSIILTILSVIISFVLAGLGQLVKNSDKLTKHFINNA